MNSFDNPDTKKIYVKTMFDNIAHSYDLLNRILSFRIDVIWRKKIIKYLKPLEINQILDIATGTADLAIMEAKHLKTKVVGVDISEEMLKFGNEKVSRNKLDHLISLKLADAESLPFENCSFDACTVAFGVRNFSNLTIGLKEIYRVLKINSPLVILEFSNPESFPIKQLYGFYFKKILPKIGKFISKNSDAYIYLPDSVSKFPTPKEFCEILKGIGFTKVGYKKNTFGISTMYFAIK